MTAKLPPMPEPAFELKWRNAAYYVSKPNIGSTSCFTAAQLQADRLAVWNAAIEAAAQEAENDDHEVQGRGYADQLGDARATQSNIVAAIRAMGDLKG